MKNILTIAFVFCSFSAISQVDTVGLLTNKSKRAFLYSQPESKNFKISYIEIDGKKNRTEEYKRVYSFNIDKTCKIYQENKIRFVGVWKVRNDSLIIEARTIDHPNSAVFIIQKFKIIKLTHKKLVIQTTHYLEERTLYLKHKKSI
jgi:hypothetical protein